MTTYELVTRAGVEAEVARQTARFETREKNFGFKPGEHYYSPVTYTWPDFYNGANSKWAKFLEFGNTLGIVILNRSSGDWLSKRPDVDFATQGSMALSAGARRVSFYIKTRHGAMFEGMPVSYRDKIATNLNVDLSAITPFTEDFIIESARAVKNDYPDIPVNIFLDETNPWIEMDLQNKIIEAYVKLYNRLKRELGNDCLIIINPGSNTPASMMAACDVVLSYESNAAKYLDPGTQWIHPEHYKGFPSWRFWHVIHGATPENIDAVFAKADSLGIGHLYVTDRTFKVGGGSEDEPEENPYDKPPSQWVENRVKAWIGGTLPFEQRLSALEVKIKELEAKRNV